MQCINSGRAREGHVVRYWANEWEVGPSDCRMLVVWQPPTEYSYALVDLGGTSKRSRRAIMRSTEWVHEYAMCNSWDDGEEDFETPADHYIIIRWITDRGMPEGNYHVAEYLEENSASYGSTVTVGYRFRNWRRGALLHWRMVAACRLERRRARRARAATV